MYIYMYMFFYSFITGGKHALKFESSSNQQRDFLGMECKREIVLSCRKPNYYFDVENEDY